jgi:hypothetical protein
LAATAVSFQAALLSGSVFELPGGPESLRRHLARPTYLAEAGSMKG